MLNRQIKILLYSSNIWYLREGMFAPLFAVFSQKIGGNILDMTQVLATYLIVSGFFTVLVGKIPKRVISSAKLMILGYGLNALFTFCYVFVSSQMSLFFVQVGLGIASSLANPTWNSLYAKYERRGPQKQIGYVWALANGQTDVLTGIGILLGGLIINSFSFNALFIIMGILQTLATIYVAQLLNYRQVNPVSELSLIQIKKR